jgi:hypothetical protein
LYVSYALHGGMGIEHVTMIDMTFGHVDSQLKRFSAL